MTTTLLSLGEGGPPINPRPRLGLGLSLGKFPAAGCQPDAHFHLNLNLNQKPASGRGFSLVELLAVVGIIAIVSVAAVPVMRGLGGSQSSRATAQILVSALEQARTAAILSGTNVYLAFPSSNTTTMTATNIDRSYAVIRPKVDLDGDNRDDFQTNFTGNWILLSKWERLPGDIVLDPLRLRLHTLTNPVGLPFPGNAAASPLRILGFTPGGGLVDAAGTNGLLFYSQAKSSVIDGIKISRYSGRVRHVGIVTNTNTF